ncbi:hypothetical protein HanHA300_Chr06g0211071 [Helianthus annuus]|nr:hypothetical protein HanHA300_Chr06g0211071 [Helianthus annuus]KAJ0573440.1 hypothetical protein HanHA89_Chr06g0226771 [Helianthus annuus]KAJ0740705.1 hypothetical protein HanOQP8_Chr06g0219761 [Helianthus annuus]
MHESIIVIPKSKDHKANRAKRQVASRKGHAVEGKALRNHKTQDTSVIHHLWSSGWKDLGSPWRPKFNPH